MKSCGLSHEGLIRARNEDRFLIMELAPEMVLLAVADGLGGMAGGEIAAQLTVDTLAGLEPQAGGLAVQLTRLIENANQLVLSEASRLSLPNMGSTCTAVLVQGKNIY